MTELFKELGDISQEILFTYELNSGTLTYLSPAIKALNVDLPAEVPEFLNLVHPEDRDYLWAQLHNFMHHARLDAEFRVLDNRKEIIHVKLTAYLLASRSTAAGWLRDITAIRENIDYAEKINARKNSLLEVVSHDLKEPVGMIALMAAAIANDPAISGNESLQGYLDVIRQLCEGNIKLIRSLVQQEFLEANAIDLRLERADLAAAVKDIVLQYAQAAEIVNKNFSFQSNRPQVFIIMDTLKIIQVVNNLVSNAIKFTEDGGRIDVSVEELNSQIRITVRDDGIGIPQELQPYLFQPRSKAMRSGLRGEEGSGMGLSIIRSLVEQHNGRVWLETAVEIGTTFYIELLKDPHELQE